MWIIKRLQLVDAQCAQGETLIPREMIAAQQQASDCLAAAQCQADALLDAARQQAQTLVQQAREQAQTLQQETRQQLESEFLAQSQRLFDGWRHEQQQQNQQRIAQCDALIQAALRQLLDEIPSAARIQALLRQLSHATPPGSDTCLYAPSALLPELRAAALPWPLAADDTLAEQTLSLRAAQGEVRISWSVLRSRFLALLTE